MWVLDSSSIHRLWATSDVDLELRPLPSTGVTRFRRYYEPLRHPKRPGLSLAGVRLAVTRRHRWGFPCCLSIPLAHMPSPVPRRDRSSFIAHDLTGGGLPHRSSRSAPALRFSRFAQRSLT